MLNRLFLSLMPFRLTQEKYVKLLTGRPDQRAVEDFVRMERWIFDSPPQAATALAQFVRWFYQENALMRGTLQDRRPGCGPEAHPPAAPESVRAARTTSCRPTPARRLQQCVGSRDYTAVPIPTGHIGMYVSRAGREEIPRRIVSWLNERR